MNIITAQNKLLSDIFNTDCKFASFSNEVCSFSKILESRTVFLCKDCQAVMKANANYLGFFIEEIECISAGCHRVTVGFVYKSRLRKEMMNMFIKYNGEHHE